MGAPPQISWPTINGYIPQWSSLDIGVGGIPPLQNLGVTGIDYECEASGSTDVFGQGTPVKLGETLGQVKSVGALTLLKAQSAVLIQALNNQFGQGGRLGYLEWRFPINVSMTMPDLSIQTDNLVSCRLMKIGDSHKQGTDALHEKWDLHLFFVVKYGIMPVGKVAGSIFQSLVPSP